MLDSNLDPVAVYEDKRVISIASPPGVTGDDTWDLTVVLSPQGTTLGQYTVKSASQAYKKTVNIATNVPFNTGEQYKFHELGTQYRVGGGSITLSQVGPELVRGGSVASLQLAGPYKYLGARPYMSTPPQQNELDAFPNGFVPTWAPTFDTNLDYNSLAQMPGAIVRDGYDGDYSTLRMSSFDWTPLEGASKYLRSDYNPIVDGWLGGEIVTGWTPTNCPVRIVAFAGLHAQVVLNLTVRAMYEVKPEPGSPLIAFQRTVPFRPLAMQTLRLMAEEAPGSYPSDYNDWGTLWMKVKKTLNALKPIVSGAVSAAGFGPAGKLIASIPDFNVEAKRTKPKPQERNQMRKKVEQKKGAAPKTIAKRKGGA